MCYVVGGTKTLEITRLKLHVYPSHTHAGNNWTELHVHQKAARLFVCYVLRGRKTVEMAKLRVHLESIAGC